MSKPKQWKQGRELRHYDVYSGRERDRQEDRKPEYWGAASGNVVDFSMTLSPYPPHEQPTDAISIGSGDAA